MAFLANLLGYQAVWFAVVWSAGRGSAWIGMAACLVFIAAQLVASKVRSADLRVLLAALACGVVVDGALASSGLLAYASPHPALPAPLWIVLLWGAFALTMNYSLAWFLQHRWWAAAFAGIGGPLAYIAAERGFDAVRFPLPAWPALLALGLAWALAFPLLLRIAGLRTPRPLEARA